MIGILMMAGMAMGADMTCADVVEIAQSGAPETTVLTIIGASTIAPEDLPCIQAAGLSPTVLDAITQRIQAQPKASPQVPSQPQPQHPQVLVPQTLTCIDAKKMISDGKTEAEMLWIVAGSTIPMSELPCIQGAGLPKTVLAAMPNHVQQSSTPPGAGYASAPGPSAPMGLAYAPMVMPDAGAAAAMSGLIGFGSGHFYACDPVGGAAFFLATLLGGGLMAGGLAWQANDPLVRDGGATALVAVGGTLFFVVHAADTATAPLAAERVQRSGQSCR